MKLLIKERVFSWTGSYYAYDEGLQPKYSIKAECLGLGRQIHVCDAHTGEKVGSVRQRLLPFMPKFDIEAGGAAVGSAEKKFTLLGMKYVVDFNGWQVDGNFMGWDYKVMDGGNTVMRISKEVLSWGDTYLLEYGDLKDELMGLLLVIAIEAANCTNSN